MVSIFNKVATTDSKSEPADRNNSGFTAQTRKAWRRSPHYQASTDLISECNSTTRLLTALCELRVFVVKLQ